MKQNPNPRTLRLRQLMTEHKLSAKRVAKMLNRSPHTVACWRSEPQIIPCELLELLELKLAGGAK